MHAQLDEIFLPEEMTTEGYYWLRSHLHTDLAFELFEALVWLIGLVWLGFRGILHYE